MAASENRASRGWRVIVVGGHTRSIGKTQLVCELIRAFPEVDWIAGKITQYGHGVCARNGENCDCAPKEHSAALDWETRSDTGTDTARFLAAGAKRALWLRTKQGFLAEGLPLLRATLEEGGGFADEGSWALILESNSLLQFLKPTLYLFVLAPELSDFKESARLAMDRADAFVLRSAHAMGLEAESEEVSGRSSVPARFLRTKPGFLQREGEELSTGLKDLVNTKLRAAKNVCL